jgi:SPP1 gp7 family putative phage head morphogenesis protein
MPDYFDSLIDKGEAKLEPILADAVRAYIKGNVNRFIDKTGELSDIVVFAQTFSDLWGRRSIIETIQQQRVPRAAIQFGKGAPGFDDAIEALTTKNAYLMEPLDFVREAYGKRRTLHEQDMQASIMKRVDKFVADALRRGETEPSATKLLADTEGWRQSYATTVYRTNVGNAFAAGQWAEASKPAFKRIFPAFKYDATLDSDTRPNHGAASGFIADVDDPAWDRFAPPLGFNCRCVLVSQTERQLRQRGLIDAEGRVTPYIPPRMAQGEAFPDPGFVKRVRPDREMYQGL